MKTTTDQMFSNGNDFMTWTGQNCELCLKHSHYNSKKDEYTKFKCRIDADMNMQIAGLYEISVRSFKTVQLEKCPNIKTESNPRKKRKIKNQTELELNF